MKRGIIEVGIFLILLVVFLIAFVAYVISQNLIIGGGFIIGSVLLGLILEKTAIKN